jgi:uncharacterized protein (DUF2147 family)
MDFEAKRSGSSPHSKKHKKLLDYEKTKESDKIASDEQKQPESSVTTPNEAKREQIRQSIASSIDSLHESIPKTEKQSTSIQSGEESRDQRASNQKQKEAAITPSGPVAANSLSPIGEWSVEDGEAHVEVRLCEDVVCGIVTSTKDPYKKDRYNPDPGLRQRSILGVRVLFDMKPTKKNRWEGKVYNINDGKIYSASITMKGPDDLRIEACSFGGLVCGGQSWTRAEEETQ